MKNSNVIKSTTDYKLFKYKKGNRKIVKGAVNRIVRAVKKRNILPSNPIIVNGKYEVIDGQHRLEAAKVLEIPIYYTVFEPASLEEIQLLNANVRQWTAIDFLNSYVDLGNQDYIDFKNFMDKHDLTFSATLLLLTNYHEIGKDIHVLFREGRFKINNIQEAEKNVEILKTFLEHSYSGIIGSSRFIESVLWLIYTHPQHMDTIIIKTIGKHKLFRVEKKSDYIRQFEDILNEGRYGKLIRLT